MHFPMLLIPNIKTICREYAVVIQIKLPTVLNMIFILFCAIINLTDQLYFYLMMDIIFSNEAPLLLTDIFQNILTMLHQSVSEIPKRWHEVDVNHVCPCTAYICTKDLLCSWFTMNTGYIKLGPRRPV